MSVTTSKRPPIDTVRKWTIALGVLTAGNMTRADAEMKLRAYVPLLQDQFPAGAFTPASLHHVAAQCKWFPSYAEVIEHLRGWWREHRPYVALPPPSPPPPRPDPTPEEMEAVSRTVREVTAALHTSAILKDTTGRSLDEAPRRPQPRHLPPDVLDRINPLPNGRKRTDATKAAVSPADAAAVVDSDTAAAMAQADAVAGDP